MYEEALDLDRREIRLLKILPGSFNDPLRCKLVKVSLDDKPKYNALSYVWGDPTVTKEILVDDIPFAVTTNLETALRHLRGVLDKPALWIDAICINQKNVQSEVNHQVQIMGDIYSLAAWVVIWLGEGNIQIEGAFRYLKKFNDGTADAEMEVYMRAFYQVHVYHLPWFNRVWTKQEMVLATKDPLFVYGRHVAWWSQLWHAWDRSTDIPSLKDPLVMTKGLDYLTVQTIYRLCMLRDAYHSESGLSLAQLIISPGPSRATDPRDMIYGVLGMLKPDQRTSYPLVDYGLPTSVVYSQAMAVLFVSGCGVRVLSLWRSHDLRPAVSGLPSWAIDFSTQTDIGLRQLLYKPICLSEGELMLASGDYGDELSDAVVTADLRSLAVSVLPVDYIDDVFHTEPDWPAFLRNLVRLDHFITSAGDRPHESSGLHAILGDFDVTEPLWISLLSQETSESPVVTFLDRFARDKALATYDDLLEECQRGQFPDEPCDYNLWRYSGAAGKTFFTTKCGLVGVAGSVVEVGDEVSLWLGAHYPFVTRPNDDNSGTCRLITWASVGGIMYGEMADAYRKGLLEAKTLQVQ
jgi:hypothetical protein